MISVFRSSWRMLRVELPLMRSTRSPIRRPARCANPCGSIDSITNGAPTSAPPFRRKPHGSPESDRRISTRRIEKPSRADVSVDCCCCCCCCCQCCCCCGGGGAVDHCCCVIAGGSCCIPKRGSVRKAPPTLPEVL